MIGVIDCKTGNLQSLLNALEHQKIIYKIIKNSTDFSNEFKIILPGVGSFKNMMNNLIDLKLYDPLKNFLLSNNHFLGICVGMQILLSEGLEEEVTKGLNIIDGRVELLNSIELKVPTIGWKPIFLNDDTFNDNEKLLKNIDLKKFYFLHSYYCNSEINTTLAYSKFEKLKYPAIIKKGNIYGVQFHPEKSREQGLQLIKNFSLI